eukprot:COSAG02_NODE_57284_length_281_cov_0.774725_1_plen_57_part_01
MGWILLYSVSSLWIVQEHRVTHVICMHPLLLSYFFNDTATTEIYTIAYTLSLHDALP